MALEVINPIMPETMGGSADLTGSNNTKTADLGVFDPRQPQGPLCPLRHPRARHGGGDERHGAAWRRAALWRHLHVLRRLRPPGAMRLSALMGVPVVYVMTHDSIGLGEDGPTHQPVEHLAMLRATPNMLVFRPADAVETAEAGKSRCRRPPRPRCWR
jgi:transketolase